MDGNTESESLISKSEVDKIELVKTGINETQNTLLKSIEKTLDRGVALNALEEKSSKMSNHADLFKKKAKETREAFCMSHWRNMLILVVLLAFIGIALYFIFRSSDDN